MSLKRRMKTLELRAGIGEDVSILVTWFGKGEHIWRERVEEARRRGWRVRVIRYGVEHYADSLDDAEDLVAKHRDTCGQAPITVYRNGSKVEEVLAEWDPGIPKWLRT